MEFRKQTLDNGLEVIAELAPHAYSAAVGFFVKTGSRDETEGNHGVSHFLEHMAFNGTKNFPHQALIDYNESIGMRFGSMNATRRRCTSGF